jgi:hypothetical protein
MVPTPSPSASSPFDERGEFLDDRNARMIAALADQVVGFALKEMGARAN